MTSRPKSQSRRGYQAVGSKMERVVALDNWSTGGVCQCGLRLPCNGCVELEQHSRADSPEPWNPHIDLTEMGSRAKDFRDEVHQASEKLIKEIRARELAKCRLRQSTLASSLNGTGTVAGPLPMQTVSAASRG